MPKNLGAATSASPEVGREGKSVAGNKFTWPGIALAAAIILALLMAYSIVLVMLGLTVQMALGATTTMCALTVFMIRGMSRPGGPIPTPVLELLAGQALPPGPGGGRGAV